MSPLHIVSFIDISPDTAVTFQYYVQTKVLKTVLPELIAKYGTVFRSRVMTLEEDNSMYNLIWSIHCNTDEDEDDRVVHKTDDQGHEYSCHMMTAQDIIGKTVVIDAVIQNYTE
jgi:hypothetical protein